MSILEAMGEGRPVVSTGVGGVPGRRHGLRRRDPAGRRPRAGDGGGDAAAQPGPRVGGSGCAATPGSGASSTRRRASTATATCCTADGARGCGMNAEIERARRAGRGAARPRAAGHARGRRRARGVGGRARAARARDRRARLMPRGAGRAARERVQAAGLAAALGRRARGRRVRRDRAGDRAVGRAAGRPRSAPPWSSARCRLALPLTLALQWGLRSRYLGRPNGLLGLRPCTGARSRWAPWRSSSLPALALGASGALAGLLTLTWTGGTRADPARLVRASTALLVAARDAGDARCWRRCPCWPRPRR